jgi:flavin-dependent dehydrogenase
MLRLSHGEAMSAAAAPDVLVIGGGPAGTTAAATLAMRGRRVRLIDKVRHPRYHIGESLIPFCYYTLARLGLADRLERSKLIKKFSVQFVGTSGAETRPFYFFEHLYHPAAVAWQVLRSDFDRMLLDNARDKGVEVGEGEQAERLLLDGAGAVVGAQVRGADGVSRALHAPLTIDASGRDALAPTQFGWRVLDRELDRFALWTYFKGALRDPGIDAGATTVAAVPGGGWFWYIPLHDDVISVGVVHRKEHLFRGMSGGSGQDALARIYEREVAGNPWVGRHLAGGTRCDDYRVTNEYSYRSRHCARDGLVLAGDALSFLDPIFSSGVYLALRMGELAAEEVDRALADGDRSAARFAEYGATVSAGVHAIRRLVYSYYAPDFTFSQAIKRDPASRVDISDLLIGNFFRDYDPFYRMVAEITDHLPQGSFAMTPFTGSQQEAQP